MELVEISPGWFPVELCRLAFDEVRTESIVWIVLSRWPPTKPRTVTPRGLGPHLTASENSTLHADFALEETRCQHGE
ncbi:hypothetical protein PUN4_910035 [Paraburkholderia unamae]|nr:hypothetical protein PUN4_910035 [Paraburkholderia unamae]